MYCNAERESESDLMVDKASQNDVGKSRILLGHHVK